MNVKIVELEHCCGLPKKAHKDDAGYDVFAANNESIHMPSGSIAKIPLGFKIEMEPGYEAQLRPRSGLASRGITMPNSPGTIDAGYRGEVSALLCNLTPSVYIVEPGMKIAQMVIHKIPEITVSFVKEEELTESDRGEGGFGHTGEF